MEKERKVYRKRANAYWDERDEEWDLVIEGEVWSVIHRTLDNKHYEFSDVTHKFQNWDTSIYTLERTMELAEHRIMKIMIEEIKTANGVLEALTHG